MTHLKNNPCSPFSTRVYLLPAIFQRHTCHKSVIYNLQQKFHNAPSPSGPCKQYRICAPLLTAWSKQLTDFMLENPGFSGSCWTPGPTYLHSRSPSRAHSLWRETSRGRVDPEHAGCLEMCGFWICDTTTAQCRRKLGRWQTGSLCALPTKWRTAMPI